MKIFLFFILYFLPIYSLDSPNQKATIEFLDSQFNDNTFNGNNFTNIDRLRQFDSQDFQMSLQNCFNRFLYSDYLYNHNLQFKLIKKSFEDFVINFNRLGLSYAQQIQLVDEQIFAYTDRFNCCQKICAFFCDTYFSNLCKIKLRILRLRKNNGLTK